MTAQIKKLTPAQIITLAFHVLYLCGSREKIYKFAEWAEKQ